MTGYNFFVENRFMPSTSVGLKYLKTPPFSVDKNLSSCGRDFPLYIISSNVSGEIIFASVGIFSFCSNSGDFMGSSVYPYFFMHGVLVKILARQRSPALEASYGEPKPALR